MPVGVVSKNGNDPTLESVLHWRMLEKVADSARQAVKLAEPYKPHGGQFLEFRSISLSTYQTCMKLTRKSAEFCQFFGRHYPHMPINNNYIMLYFHSILRILMIGVSYFNKCVKYRYLPLPAVNCIVCCESCVWLF